MVDFAVHALPLMDAGIKVVAASVDPIKNVSALKDGLRVGYPMFGEIDVHEVSEATGAFFQTGERTCLHATGFLVNPEGSVNTAVYSTGPIGRFSASEVIRKVLFEKRKAVG